MIIGDLELQSIKILKQNYLKEYETNSNQYNAGKTNAIEEILSFLESRQPNYVNVEDINE